MDVPYVAPATETEKQLAAMFEQLLGVERVGTLDDFFSLGGHSLLAMMLINRVRNAFQVEIPDRRPVRGRIHCGQSGADRGPIPEDAVGGSPPDALKQSARDSVGR